MTDGPARAGASWLALREPADAASRSLDLVAEVRAGLAARAPGATRKGTTVHDLGCGSGSMARWLAPLLDGPQHWVMYDRDVELLGLAGTDPPRAARDGAPVTTRTRPADITRLGPGTLAAADLLTASAVLDMMTTDELDRFVETCDGPGCAVLVALTVVGRVELDPGHPLDRDLAAAFDAHQRRDTAAGRLLGPDASSRAVAGFVGRGRDVTVRPSPWRLGPADRDLQAEWLTGWVEAACAQRPALRGEAAAYVRRRRAELAAGRLAVVVHHLDLLVRPRPRPGPGR